jgi:hypothetical protein
MFCTWLLQGARVYTDRWVGIWSSNSYNQPLAFYLGMYAALGVVYGLFTFCRCVLLSVRTLCVVWWSGGGSGIMLCVALVCGRADEALDMAWLHHPTFATRCSSDGW